MPRSTLLGSLLHFTLLLIGFLILILSDPPVLGHIICTLLSLVRLSVQGLRSLSLSVSLYVKMLTTSLCFALLFSFVFFSSTSPGLLLSLSLSLILPCLSGCLSVLPRCALTAIKRLPFMRNRSKDKDKAKAIYRRSMCKTPVSRHASHRHPPPLPPRHRRTGRNKGEPVTDFQSGRSVGV